ncbi:GNAT family N-acetyltransferase [Geodermatophilus sabuli]|uniref:FR47-like protein n=1 Tax=Geodermatophilus sabuli TaxID=1564158 RepID=A0A285EBD7_9ACTN|nr:GNAT family N-acetyltransferase [Geodermatophilus sabuli]MBB3084311.1 putative N-acetyltransferase YhbS [Geodermatophilus sabuli]SNX96419.1 FR47-like protein [Geodermatophilus sabuli]
MPTSPGLLECIERYFAAAPLPDARIETAGALDVPVGSPDWPYPARPRPGERVTTDDVRAAVAVQQRAGLPVALEWVCESAPSAAAAVRAAGLAVDESPLLVAADPVDLLLPYGVRLYLVGADDPELPRYQQLVSIAFAHPGPRADVGDAAVEAVPESSRSAVLRERIATGRTVMMVAVERGEPVAVGAHHPVDVDGTEVSEITGVATLPRLRGRGLGAGLASALAAHARETAELVFLVAGDDDVARVYERIGFAWLATVGVADLPDGDLADTELCDTELPDTELPDTEQSDTGLPGTGTGAAAAERGRPG